MRRVNYKSDFDFTAGLRDCRGEAVGWPECDWDVRFWTGSRAQVYVASRRGGVYVNCFPEGDGRMHFVLDGHRLSAGVLMWELHVELPDGVYRDGVRDLYRPEGLDVELVTGAGDCGESTEVEAMLPYIKGDPFTWADFTPEQIAELQGPAREAAEDVERLEAGVAAAEQERVRNENHRIEAETERHRRETLRQSAETTRQANETEREENEEGRVAAEAERAEEFAGFAGKIAGKMDGHYEDTDVVIDDIEPLALERAKYKVFDDEWVAAGGTVIVSGVTYGCNGIDDLTYKEAVEIKQLYIKRKGVDYSGMFFTSTVRALLPIWIPNAVAINLTSMFQSSSKLTKIVFRSNISRCIATVKDLFATFHTCSKLKEIDVILNVSNASNVDSLANFRDSSNLEEVRIYGLKTNIYFYYSPKLSIDSISYLVDNAANTTAITVTVHPDVFAKLTDENNVEWHSVLTDAVARNITFATV